MPQQARGAARCMVVPFTRGTPTRKQEPAAWEPHGRRRCATQGRVGSDRREGLTFSRAHCLSLLVPWFFASAALRARGREPAPAKSTSQGGGVRNREVWRPSTHRVLRERRPAPALLARVYAHARVQDGSKAIRELLRSSGRFEKCRAFCPLSSYSEMRPLLSEHRLPRTAGVLWYMYD